MKKNLKKTLIVTLITSLITTALAVIVQLKGESRVRFACSYLDPITIDLLAFGGGLFLIIEGLYRIDEHSNATIKSQITRIIRVAGGCAIITLHIMQFIHK